MKKLQILVIVLFISISIYAVANIPMGSALTPQINLNPSRGLVGAVVTISGTQFASDSALTATFGGSTVTLSGNPTTNQIGTIPGGVTFTVPASSPGSQTVQVTDGSANTASTTFTVTIPLAAPTISASHGLLDQGQTSTLTSTVVTSGISPYSYQWLSEAPGAGSFSSIGGATSTSYDFAPKVSTAVGVWSFELRVTDSASAVVTSNIASVTVSSALAAPTVSAAPGSINQGQTSSLTSSTVTTGTSPYTYQWLQKASGASIFSSITGATSSSYNFATTGTTTVGAWSFELQVSDAAGSSVTSAAASVTVNSAPTVTLSPTSWTMDVGQIKPFTASASGGSGSYSSYQWYVDGVAQSGATTSSFSFIPGSVGSYSITVTVRDSLGTTSALSLAASVSVAASPTVSVAPVGPLPMDVGQTKTFTATAAGGSGVIHYQWYLGATTVGTDSSSYTYTASGTSASITCKVTDSASTPVTSNPSNAVVVTVSSALVAPSVSAAPGSVSQGQTCSLSSSAVTTGSSPYAYQWLSKAPGAGSFSSITGATSSSYSFATAGSTAVGAWSFELQVTDAAGAQITSAAASVTVNAAPMDHFVFSSVSSQTAGTSFSITVTAKDAFGNTAVGYVGTPSLSYSAGSISPTVMPAFVAGVGTVSVSVTVAGLGVSITATDGAHSGASNSFTVNAGAATRLVVSSGTSQVAGTPFSVTVTAKDANGNTATGYLGTVHFSSSDSGTGVSLPSNYAFKSGDLGTHTFTSAVSLMSVGTQSVTATDTATSSIAGSQAGIVVKVSSGIHFVVTGFPDPATAGSAGTVTVTVKDQFGNVYSGYTGIVKITSTDSSAVLPANAALTSGVGSFGVTLKTAGSQSIFATDTANSAINGSQTGLTVNSAGLDHFAFSFVGDQTAGSAFTLRLLPRISLRTTLLPMLVRRL